MLMGSSGILIDEDAIKAIRSLINENRRSGFIKGIAIALIAAPEPFTTAIGIGLLGLAKSVDEKASLNDVLTQFNSIMSELSELSI